nr:hypothetical protein StreXyl84_10310 [Streptomyces sp. Xyl84]
MLVNCNSDRFRKRRVREALPAVPPEVAGHDEAVSWTDERRALLAALAGLPRKQRAVIKTRTTTSGCRSATRPGRRAGGLSYSAPRRCRSSVSKSVQPSADSPSPSGQ